MRALVVLNPNATATSARTRDVLLSALSNDLRIDVVETTHRGHATELSRHARADGVRLVVAVGGDGTINEVVNGVLDPVRDDSAPDGGSVPNDGPAPDDDAAHDRPASPYDPPDVGIVPCGSTNVLARNLGIPRDPIEATGLLLDAIRAGRRQSITLGRLDDRYFTFTAGFGFDADVVQAVEQARSQGRASTVPLYIRTALRRLFAQPDRRRGQIDLVADGGPPTRGLSVVIVTNCTPWTYVGDLPLRPTPRTLLNGGLDVFGLTSLRLPTLLVRMAQLTSQRGPRGRNVISLHDCRRLVLTAAEPLPAEVDGDYVGERARMVLTSVPDALRVAY